MCIQGRIRYVVGNICIKTSFGHWTGARSVDGRIGVYIYYRNARARVNSKFTFP